LVEAQARSEETVLSIRAKYQAQNLKLYTLGLLSIRAQYQAQT
jgi:hypothetical protein